MLENEYISRNRRSARSIDRLHDACYLFSITQQKSSDSHSSVTKSYYSKCVNNGSYIFIIRLNNKNHFFVKELYITERPITIKL